MRTRDIHARANEVLQAMIRVFEDTRWTKGEFTRTAFDGKVLFCTLGAGQLVVGQMAGPSQYRIKGPDEELQSTWHDARTAIATAITDDPTFRTRVRSSQFQNSTKGLLAFELKDWDAGAERHASQIILSFNDHPDTTKEDVLKVLEAAQQYDIINFD